jgi:hypothetical protein
MNSRQLKLPYSVVVVLVAVLAAQLPAAASSAELCGTREAPIRCAAGASSFDVAAEEEGTALAVSHFG